MDTFDVNDSGDDAAVTPTKSMPDRHSSSAQDADLRTRLGNLPVELYDIIKDLTFKGFIEDTYMDWNLNPGLHGSQDRYPKPNYLDYVAQLKILQLDHDTRTKYAEMFYEGQTFTFAGKSKDVSERLCWLTSFLNSMPAEHRAFIGTLVVEFWLPGNCSYRHARGEFHWQENEAITTLARKFGNEVAGKMIFSTGRYPGQRD